MAGGYKDLVFNKRFLRRVTSSNLDQDELDEAEKAAKARIDSKLGRDFDALKNAGQLPFLIEHVADLLGSGIARNFLVMGNAPNMSNHEQSMLDLGKKILDDVFHGRRGLVQPDGTELADFPGPLTFGEVFLHGDAGQPTPKRFYFHPNLPWHEQEDFTSADHDPEARFLDPDYAEATFDILRRLELSA